MKTYKYLGHQAALCFLKDQTLRFSQPNSFNDPFEMQPEFWVTDSKYMENKSINCQFVLHGHDSNYKKYLIDKDAQSALLSSLKTKDLVGDLSKNIGILCLTEAKTLLPMNLLMWSHYAESHRGIVIEFHSDSEFIKNASFVNYIDRRPLIDASLLYENEYVSIDDLYFKHKCWAYEKEKRITVNLTDCTPVKECKDPLGNDIYVKSVPISAIKAIYVGCNASDEIKKLAINMHNKHRVKYLFLKINNEEYKLVPYHSAGYEWSEIYSLSNQLRFERDKI